jgi:hypothetical protein
MSGWRDSRNQLSTTQPEAAIGRGVGVPARQGLCLMHGTAGVQIDLDGSSNRSCGVQRPVTEAMSYLIEWVGCRLDGSRSDDTSGTGAAAHRLECQTSRIIAAHVRASNGRSDLCTPAIPALRHFLFAEFGSALGSRSNRARSACPSAL